MANTKRKYVRQEGANPPGRPHVSEQNKLLIANFRITKAEKAADKRLAKALGLDLSEFYRKMREVYYDVVFNRLNRAG